MKKVFFIALTLWTTGALGKESVVIIPQSEIQVDQPVNYSDSSISKNKTPRQVGFGLLHWQPRAELTFPTYQARAENFQSAWLNGATLYALFSPFIDQDWITLKPALGVSIFQFKRRGVTTIFQSAKEDSQEFYLMPIRLGVRLSSTRISFKWLQPYFQIEADPILGLTTSSTFSEDTSEIGLSFQLQFGLAANFRDFGVYAAATRTQGSVLGNSIDGLSVESGLTIGL